MSSASSGAGSQHQPSSSVSSGGTAAAALTAGSSQARRGGQCCSECNSQIWSSYVVGLLACLLVVGGIFLAFHRWDYLWLAVSAVGVLLILIGASLHYCGGGGGRTASAAGEAGTRAAKRKRGSNHHRIVCELGNQNERLLPSAPPSGISGSSGHNFSVSQLSLNALPPFFQSYDTVSLGTQVASSPTVGPPVSPIMHLNGQSFLLLPIGGSSAETASEANSLAHRLSTHLAVLEQQSLSQKRYPEAVNFGLVPCLTSFAGSKDPALQQEQSIVMFAPGKTQTEGTAVATIQEEEQRQVSEPVETVIAIPREEVVQPEEEEEPIYQVPRIASTQATANISQTDPDMCTAPLVEHSNVTTQSVAQIVSTQPIVESSLLGEATSLNEQTTDIIIEEEEMPNESDVLSNDASHVNFLPESAETVPAETDASVPISITIDAAMQEEDIPPNDLTIDPDSRVSTPEPNWTLPPSYEEVAPPNFKRLGRNKFAYETM